MEATITCRTDLISGGCNACPTVASTTYAISFDGVSVPMDSLDVASLVMAAALKKGYRQELVMDFSEDVIVFKKEGKEIRNEELYGTVSYESGIQKISTKNEIKDEKELFAKVNEILETLFDIAPINFTVVTPE